MDKNSSSLNLLADLVAKGKAAGADSCDGLLVESISLSSSQRLGKPEHLERSESRDLGLRVFVGKRQAIVSSSDVSETALKDLVEKAIAMVRAIPEDPYCGLAEADALARDIPDMDACDPIEPSGETLATRAAKAEDAARSVKGVTNSEGAEAGWAKSTVSLAASNGFSQTRTISRHSIATSVLAGTGTSMERDYEESTTVYGEDLRKPEDIGLKAGTNAVARLNPKKIATAQVPVVYAPRVSRSLLSHLASAINGVSVARGASFLKDKLGQKIFPENITIIDDPLRRRGLRSRPFDAEGLAVTRRNVIDEGVLSTWILDLRSARQLAMQPTGSASRGVSSTPSPTVSNLFLEAGGQSAKDLMCDIKEGFYITELIGMGVNQTSGDYSRGASGFWIENGEISYPVSEVSVAGNLNDMFASMSAADDLEFCYGINAPSLRIDAMTVAGK
jgi:PmbA protein